MHGRGKLFSLFLHLAAEDLIGDVLFHGFQRDRLPAFHAVDHVAVGVVRPEYLAHLVRKDFLIELGWKHAASCCVHVSAGRRRGDAERSIGLFLQLVYFLAFGRPSLDVIGHLRDLLLVVLFLFGRGLGIRTVFREIDPAQLGPFVLGLIFFVKRFNLLLRRIAQLLRQLIAIEVSKRL